MVLRGNDPKALDVLEELMLTDPPPQRPFTVFQIKHTRASWIVINLKDYFSDEEKDDDDNSRNGRVYYYFDQQPQKKTEEARLSGKKKVKFVYDIDTIRSSFETQMTNNFS